MFTVVENCLIRSRFITKNYQDCWLFHQQQQQQQQLLDTQLRLIYHNKIKLKIKNNKATKPPMKLIHQYTKLKQTC